MSVLVGLSEPIVLLMGGVICVLSGWGIYTPESLVRFVARVMDHDSGIWAAIAVRLVLGVALIIAAGESRFPLAFQVLGWIAIVAALGLRIAGRRRMRKLVGRLDRLSPSFVRLWLLLGFAFGGFLIFGAT